MHLCKDCRVRYTSDVEEICEVCGGRVSEEEFPPDVDSMGEGEDTFMDFLCRESEEGP